MLFGVCKRKTDNGLLMELLHCNSVDSDAIWKYPQAEDVHIVKNEQILFVQVNGDWNLFRQKKH